MRSSLLGGALTRPRAARAPAVIDCLHPAQGNGRHLLDKQDLIWLRRKVKDSLSEGRFDLRIARSRIDAAQSPDCGTARQVVPADVFGNVFHQQRCRILCL